MTWVKEDQYGNNIWSHSFDRQKEDIFRLWYNNIIWGLEKTIPSDCTAKGEWHYDATSKKLYLYSAYHPPSYYKSVRISSLERGIGSNHFKDKVQRTGSGDELSVKCKFIHNLSSILKSHSSKLLDTA